MKLYAGIDLHSNNNYLAIIDEQDQRVYQKRLPNEPDVVLAELACQSALKIDPPSASKIDPPQAVFFSY